MNNPKWNTKAYTTNFSFVHEYGEGLFNLIETPSGATAIDLGCGNGALTKKLTERGFKTIGLDASKEFIDLAKKRFDNIEFIHADATSFDLKNPVDLIFSNAVFHWIDQEKQIELIRSINRNLKPGGELIFEFGGYGNNKLIHEVMKELFNQYGYDYQIPFYFPTISEYSNLLEENGFLVTYAHLFDRLTELKGENGLKDWFNMFLNERRLLVTKFHIKEKISNNIEH